MADDTKPNTSDGDGKNTGGSGAGAGTQTGKPEDAPKFTQADLDQKINERLKEQRERIERDRKAADEKATREATEKKAIEDGKLQEVIASRDQTIADLTPKAEKADRLAKRLHAIVDAKVATLPESVRALIPADKADVEARWDELEKVERIMATVPTAVRPGNGPDPKPAGGVDPAKDRDAVRTAVTQQRSYSL